MPEDNAVSPAITHEQNFSIPNEIFLKLAEQHHPLPECIIATAPYGWLLKLWPQDKSLILKGKL